MAFEFGIFQEFPRYPAQSDAEAFAQSFAQADAAEHFGLDAVWLAELHFAGLQTLLDAFACEETPYLSRPFPKFAPRFSDYDHLARVKEWSATGGESDNGDAP